MARTWVTRDADSTFALKTNRIGLFAIHASAPVSSAQATVTSSRTTLRMDVNIAKVSTGNPLLDPEVHALVMKSSDGSLVFEGHGADLVQGISGEAAAGNVTVPLTLTGGSQLDGDDLELPLLGTAVFRDLHLPLPGLGHVKELRINIEGLLRLAPA